MLTVACWHTCPGGHSWLEGTRDLKHVGPSNWSTSEVCMQFVLTCRLGQVEAGLAELVTTTEFLAHSNTTSRIVLPNVTSLPNLQ